MFPRQTVTAEKASLVCFLILVAPISFSEDSATAKESDVPNFQQPIPFSHKQHSKLKLECLFCHPMSGSGDLAGIPVAGQCMACHQKVKNDSPAIQILAGYSVAQKPVPWIRIYEIPDFVFFNHRKHAEARIQCQTCHGPVETRDSLWKERETSMKACVDCHRDTQASVECHLCHELNQ